MTKHDKYKCTEKARMIPDFLSQVYLMSFTCSQITVPNGKPATSEVSTATIV